jgi:hypothetical protein
MADLEQAVRDLINSQSNSGQPMYILETRARRRQRSVIIATSSLTVLLLVGMVFGGLTLLAGGSHSRVRTGASPSSSALYSTPRTEGKARAIARSFLDDVVLPTGAKRILGPDTGVLSRAGNTSPCNRQVDVARFWSIPSRTALSTARFLEGHTQPGMTSDGVGFATSLPRRSATHMYTYNVHPASQNSNYTEIFFALIDGHRPNSTRLRADAIVVLAGSRCVSPGGSTTPVPSARNG